jgi:hypothetical protein
MTIDEAINRLETPSKLETGAHSTSYDIAIRLGLEALKRVRERRKYLLGNEGRPLPGETPE